MDIEEIRRWHSIFKPNNELFEIRILGDRTYSGYFFDVEKAIAELKPYDNNQIYFTVNEVNKACSGRTQFDHFEYVKGSATSKADIVHRWWIPIDIDVERPSNISSSDEEKEYAHKKALAVYNFFKEAGLPQCIVCDSSSGFHLYLPADIDNNSNTEKVVKEFYTVLSSIFTDERVKIDKAVSDANRIMRLYGTWGRKGRNTAERPHRQSKILRAPKSINKRVTVDDLNSFILKYRPIKEEDYQDENGRYIGVREPFDIRAFIQEHGIEVEKELPHEGGIKFILKECPFDSNHKAPDSAIFQSSDGKMGFKCFHDSCADYDWKALRLKFDPHAYDRKNEPQYGPQYRYQAPPKPKYEIKQELPELGKKWFCMSDIKKVDLSQIECVKTGFDGLDNLIVGLNMGEVSIVSGSNSSGKSSWLNTVILNIIDQNYKAALWSGELPPYILKTWMLSAAAGSRYLAPSKKVPGRFYVPDNIAEKIDAWMDGKFFLYNNEYTNKWEQIFHDMTELVKVGVKVFILDNLFSLDIDIFDGDKNTKQKDLILQVCKFAKDNQAHLILVAHPRKSLGFLRKNDISGSGDLANAVDNIFIIHRVNNDFLKAGGEFLGVSTIQKYADFGNCVEIAKNRMYGQVDKIIGMHYEVDTRRFKSSEEEYRNYGWDVQDYQPNFPAFANPDFGSTNPYEEVEDLPFD